MSEETKKIIEDIKEDIHIKRKEIAKNGDDISCGMKWAYDYALTIINNHISAENKYKKAR